MKYRFLRFPDFRTKAVTFSFDDGHRHDIRLLEIMNAHGIRGTFNLNGWAIQHGDPAKYITAEELHDIYDPCGHEIANHGYDHRALVNLDPPEAMDELLQGRRSLEQALGRIVRGYVYADRAANTPEIRNMVRLSGAAYARSGPAAGTFAFPEDFYHWTATCKFNDANALTLADEFLSAEPRKAYCARRDSLLFYTWGHSFECPQDNWERITCLCQKLGDRGEEIWYATNIELYDYYMAYRSLQTNLDNTILHNPSTQRLWLDWDDRRITIAPNETLFL